MDLTPPQTLADKNTREIEDSIVDGFMLVEELVYTCKRDELVLEDRFICREISLIERGKKGGGEFS